MMATPLISVPLIMFNVRHFKMHQQVQFWDCVMALVSHTQALQQAYFLYFLLRNRRQLILTSYLSIR